MLTIELDHNVPNTMPIPTDKSMHRVFLKLETLLSHTIIPYFRNDRGVSLVQLADLRQSIFLRRMEDEGNKVVLPTLLLRQGRRLAILIHEKLFDCLASVLSSGPEFRGPDGDREERGLLKFSEFLLRQIWISANLYLSFSKFSKRIWRNSWNRKTL